jgi:DSBA-like thioredoxin domain
MKHLRFTFDVISPYAHLAFERLPQVLQGVSHEVTYQPVLLAGLLQHWGQKGPAEIAPKRDWTYRQVMWLAHQLGTPLQMPAQHPFNPLALLRLSLACAPAGGTPNRWVCEQLLQHVWRDGADAADANRLAALTQTSSSAPHQRPPRVASSVCPRSRSTAVCSGGSTAWRCCRPTCVVSRGSAAPSGTRPPACPSAFSAALDHVK